MPNGEKKSVATTNGSLADSTYHPVNFHIVGVGASAGGLEALESFFETVSPDLGIAYVVVQHLSPDFKSHMEELLARRTKMKIHRVTNGLPIEPDSIYLIPPGMDMVISEGKLLLTEKSANLPLSHPIDQFLRALAADAGRYAIAVILSGTGSDGSRGIRDVHESGGLVLVQDEASARFDGMPLNALATGVASVVADPKSLAQTISRYVKEGASRDSLEDHGPVAVADSGLARIIHLLRSDHGIDFSLYKSSTIGRRIERRMQLENLSDIESYAERLSQDRQELNELYKDLLIGVTKFFRDQEAFEILENDVIPHIVADTNSQETIRIWIAGCASGEEAYSIAIIVNDHIAKHKPGCEVRIFATDIHHGSLAAAAKGAYDAQSLSELSDAQRVKYFRKQRDSYVVSTELRRQVLFAPHNVLSDAPFTQMDLVVCRNLLIYLQPQPQKKALSMFHFALKTGGTLWLGPSESPGDISDEFQTIDARWKFYRKRRDVRLPIETRSPLLATRTAVPIPLAHSNQSTGAPVVDRSLLSTYDRLLDRYMPASLLVGEKLDLIHTFGGAEKFLRLKSGRATTHLLEILADDLKASVAGAIQHATRTKSIVRYSGITHAADANTQLPLRISVEPIHDEVTSSVNFHVVIEPEDEQPGEHTSPEIDFAEVRRNHVQSLESELRYTHENLQATIEELETSNEELQATNEELVASNEELQSTNEELHSVNEELYTVNAEHQRRVQELAESNDDMDNLLATTRVGVIFLDADLYLRRFTPEVARVFHLVPQDIGRSITSFSNNLHYENLHEDLVSVLTTSSEIEREVSDLTGRSFIVRISTYHSANQPTGVVLTLIDVSQSNQLKAEATKLADIIDATPDFVATVDSELRVTYLNAAARTLFNVPPGQDLDGLQPADFHTPESIETIRAHAIPEAKRLGRWRGETELLLPSGKVIPVSQVILAHRDERGDVTQYSTLMRDISYLRDSQAKIAASETQLRSIIDNMLSFVGLMKTDGTLLEANLTATEAAGISRTDVIGKKFWDCHWWNHSELVQERLQNAISAAAGGEIVRYDEVISLKDNAKIMIDFMIVPVHDDQGRVTRLVPSGTDISARKEAEAALRLRQIAIQSATNGILIADATKDDFPITYVNEGFVSLTGYSSEEAVGRNCRFLQGKDTDRDDVLVIREALKAGESCRVTLLNYRKDGSRFWNDLQISPVRDDQGKLVSFVGIQTDVTNQIEAEEKATETAERILALLDSTAEGIYGIDKQGCCTFCNRACLEILGYDRPEELVGKNMHDLVHHTHQDEQPYPQSDCPIYKAFESGQRVHVDDEYFFKKDGTGFPVEYWSHPIRRDGKISGAVVTFFDSTQRIEEQNQLLRAQEAADAANKAKSQFLANISHELRTPLAVMLGFADIMREETQEDGILDRLTVIQRNGDYLLKLLNDILDLSRVESGSVRVRKALCDFEIFLSDLHDMMQIRSTERRCPLTFTLSRKLPSKIKIDEARLRQVLVNLIGNAIKFSPDGEVDVAVEFEQQNDHEGIVRFRVKDTGIGMSPDQIQGLFQPFSQASEEIAKEFGGTGLGLSICKRLVDTMGAALSVESRKGVGSCFEVAVPATFEGELKRIALNGTTAKVRSSSDPATGTTNLGYQVLLADDMRDIRFVAKHFLEKAGCSVDVVENGQLAIESIQRAAASNQNYDVAIIDMQMPVMDGFETIKAIRESGLPIATIALTADAMKGTEARILNAGFDAYLSKPIKAPRLIRKVVEAVKSAQSEE